MAIPDIVVLGITLRLVLSNESVLLKFSKSCDTAFIYAKSRNRDYIE